MSDGLDDLLGDTSTSGAAPSDGGKLRQQLEAILAERNELKAQLQQVAQQQRQTQLTALAAKHQIPAKALNFFPADADLTDEAATAFVEEYGELWGVQATQATTTPAQQAAAQAAQAFTSQAAPPPVAPQTEDDFRAQFATAKTRDEFLQMLNQFEAAGIAGE